MIKYEGNIENLLVACVSLRVFSVEFHYNNIVYMTTSFYFRWSAVGLNTSKFVFKTWTGSSASERVNDSPPSTNTLSPTEAIACPERPLGDGPMFPNIYQRWSTKRKKLVKTVNDRNNSLTWYFKCYKIDKIISFDSPPTKDVNDVADECRSMALARTRNGPSTVKFGPLSSGQIESPNIVVVIPPVSSSKTILPLQNQDN